MAGIAHLGTGFAFKRGLPSISIWMLLLASEFIEILWGIFALLGLDTMGNSPWSHSLFMAAVWANLFGVISARLYRDKRKGVILGAIVFSHWILDFITHPMGAIFGKPGQAPDLPLFFGDTPKVGLGLYNRSKALALGTELVITAIGLALFLTMKRDAKTKMGQKVKEETL